AYEFREFVAGFDAQTGKELWTNESESTYSRFPQSGSPTVIGNRLFILGAGRQARCLDPRTGQELWKTPLPGEFRDEYYQASVLVVGQIAIFNSAQLFGLDIETGKIVWTGDPQKTKGTHASPVLWSKDGRNYVISLCANGHTICLDPQSGEVLWTIESEGGHASPVVVGDRLLVYGNSRKKGLHCYQLSPSGAESLWLYQRLTDKGSSPIVAQNRVYVQGERKLACLDLETGSQLWMANLDMENPQWGSPIAAGNVGFYAYDGLLAFSLAPEEYRQLFIAQINQEHLLASEQYFRDKFRLDDDSLDTEARKTALKNYQQEVGKSGPLKCSSPAFDNGRIYLRLANHLICYDLRAQP
ncbi:MAG: PQQ-like beta-propeller repeat protein, partial [Planctomycetaceae bacterium]|nr:PQQ-like beta-propeller repeat protein [Planctomycetaceae bacterium]